MKRLAIPGLFSGGLFLIAASLPTGINGQQTTGSDSSPQAAERPVSYSRDIRPILSDNCYACHGPDAKQLKAGLRLDKKESVFGKLGSGAQAVIPGKPNESRLLQVVAEPDDELRMPPPKTGKRLTADQVALLRRWVEQGAGWESHWSYIPPQRLAPSPAAEEGRDGGSDGNETPFIRNDIDRFVIAKLRELKLSPAPEADRVTLIRRLYFDLIGLPPAPADVDAFVNDSSDQAYEKLLDRVLSSPHYGERMAMYWLDLVRYGDTNGYHADVHRNVSPYRDYVLRAFDSNKPFDQFTIEQLAGDLLPTPDSLDAERVKLERLIASGYNRMNMITTEGGAQAKEYLAKYAADRVRNASTVWLAGTLGCAECHNHKFDPFTTRDFYSFAAFFADVKQVGVYPNLVDLDPQIMVPTPEQTSELARLDGKIAELKTTLDTQTPELDAAEADWEHAAATARIDWTVLQPSAMSAESGTTLTEQADGSVLASGERTETDTYVIEVKTDLKAITAVRLDALPDDSLPNKGPGQADNGNFVVSHFEIELLPADGGEPLPVPLQNATASFEQKGGNLSVASAIAERKPDQQPGWAIADKFGQPHHAVFETKSDVGDGAATTLRIRLVQSHGTQHTLGRFRLSATTVARPVSASSTKLKGLPDDIADIVLADAATRTDAQKQSLAKHYRGFAPLLEPARKELAETTKSRELLDKAIPRTLVTKSADPLVMRILPRGNWMDESGEIVQPGVPQFLPQPSRASAAGSCEPNPDVDRRMTRLELARWLVARDNPLTARVFVNRLWKIMFGQGIVRTTDDFGSQGAPPTHPELLDWLAVEFVDSGWDVKHTLKIIAMSGTYRQSSQASAELRRVDPYNQWLARQGRFRIDAEMVRDNALAVSGLLSRKMGGRSVKPYQPDGYWDHCNTFQGKLVYDQDHGADLYRRSLYTYWKRTFLHPAMVSFDAPTREECTADRPRSNTPLQALVLLNDPTFVEAARVFAEQIIQEGGPTTESRLQFAYLRALSRPPRSDEMELLTALLQQHLDQYRAETAAANDLIHIGEWPVPEDIDVVELASWTSVVRVILNLHETITRY